MYKSVHGGDIYSEQNNSLGKNIVDIQQTLIH